MIDEQEIWACANELIKQHGPIAWFVAAQRADQLLAAGEIDGHKTFKRILDRIKQLETMVPPGALH